ncbi:hypothetical protein SLS62_007915 [Diatrype stigma]|uniref:Major facilitator superfamily (MFS) profile domain-containing protein n=1 Tax=Diatrype stigma TaxID=117547 RepID=A0AAN9UVW4_9PEZI
MLEKGDPEKTSNGSLKEFNAEYQRDQALGLLPDPDIDKSEEEKAKIDKKLMWKVDRWIVPWLSLLYLLSFLDRTNIGNARLAGMEEDLGMQGNDYNNSLTIFFVSYALVEPITNAMLKRLSPRVFFTGIIVIWGLIQTFMGLVTSYGGLLAARFFLGAAEAGLFPGVNYYLSCWYKGSEIGVRSAVFFSAAALAGSFGGLLAAAIALMDGIGGRPGWAWIFILEGIATTLVGVVCWWMVFDWPDTARFLTPQERIRVQRRLILDRQGYSAQDNDRRHMYEAAKDWKTYGYMVVYTAMGYVGTKAQLLSVPPYAAAAAVTVAVGFLADKTRCRGYCNIGTVLIGMAGFVMLLASAEPNVQYGGVFLGAIGIYPTISNTLSWVANNTEGALKRAVVLGMVVGWGNLNGVVSSNIYISHEKPRYWSGHGVVLGYQTLFLLGGSVFMHLALRAENRKRAAGKRDNMLDGLTEEEKMIKGDMRPDFMYTL